MANVQERLHFRGRKQREIARELGFSDGYFSELCRGKKQLPLHAVVPLARLLNISIEEVVLAFTEAMELDQANQAAD